MLQATHLPIDHSPRFEAGFFIASKDGGQAFSKDPPNGGFGRRPSPVTVNVERTRPMFGVILIAVIAAWAPEVG